MDQTLTFLSDYAVNLTFDNLAKDVVYQVKRRTIDALGCAMGSYRMQPPAFARSYALQVTGKPGATVLGTKHRSSPDLAAFANGVMVRYLDFNDTGLAAESGHPSDNIPAVLAAAEYAGADLHSTIAGIVLAYEVQNRLGEATFIREQGWDHVTYVAISAAAGASKALGLSREQTANALALAATANVTLRQNRIGTLSMWKGCAAGNAGRNGVFAAIMARQGLTGPAEAFDGPKGWIKQVPGHMTLPPFGGDGRLFKVQESKFKVFPTDYEVQCAIHPVLELRQELGGKTDNIRKIAVETYFLAVDCAADTPDKWNPTTRETADHSLPYALAVAFRNGTVWLDDFTEERIRDPEVRQLMQKIVVRENAEYTKAYPEANCFRIEVTLDSGEKHVREVKYAKGHPKNPISDKEIEAKFRRLAEPLLTAKGATQALDRLWQLENLKSVGKALELFAVPER